MRWLPDVLLLALGWLVWRVVPVAPSTRWIALGAALLATALLRWRSVRGTRARLPLVLWLEGAVFHHAWDPAGRDVYVSLLVFAAGWLGAFLLVVDEAARRRGARLVARASWGMAIACLGAIGAEWLARRAEPRSFHDPIPYAGSQVRELYVRDVRLGHRMQAGFRGRFRHPEYGGESFATNEAGFRDRSWDEDEPPGALRVLVLGDSMVVGLGMEREEALPARLERALERRLTPARAVRVRNLAVPGYGPAHHRILLEDHLRHWPAEIAVVFFYDGNDLAETSAAWFTRGESLAELDVGTSASMPERIAVPSPRPGPLWTRRAWFRASAFARFAERTLAPTFARLGIAPPTWVYNDDFVRAMARLPDRVTGRALERVLRAFRGMAAHARRAGVRLVVVRLPTKLQVERGAAEELLTFLGLDPADFDSRRPGSVVLEEVARLGVEGCDLLPALAHDAPHGSPHYFFEGHVNRAGHRLVAERLAAFLLAPGD